MKKKITFTPLPGKEYLPVPCAAKKCIPDWFTKFGNTTDGSQEKLDTNGDINFTVKKCMPFLDSLLSGYMFTAPVDLQVTTDYDNKDARINWSHGEEIFVGTHAREQIPAALLEGYPINQPFIWKTSFAIETPKGYSVLFTHPYNRHDLPFTTLSGVVDTDVYPLQVNFPFFLRPNTQDRIFTIEKGTPLCQIIPIKRDSWTSNVNDAMTKSYFIEQIYKLKSKIFNSYKTNFRQKKYYN